jgi:uncharacterized protein (TIGR02186 family)
MRARLLLLLLPAFLALVAPARGEGLVADLSSHVIGITTGFTGSSVVLFGATEGGGDIVVVVRGAAREMVVRRKSRVGFIWVNTRQATFTDVPSFYAIASSRPLAEITTPATRSLHQLGLDNLRLGTRGRVKDDVVDFRAALIRNMQREALFADSVGKVDFLGDRLFRATVTVPSNVPTGTYLVEVFLIRDKQVVAGQTVPLTVTKIGVDAEVYDFADRRAALYGIIAVLGAAMAGWLASLPFRTAAR